MATTGSESIRTAVELQEIAERNTLSVVLTQLWGPAQLEREGLPEAKVELARSGDLDLLVLQARSKCQAFFARIDLTASEPGALVEEMDAAISRMIEEAKTYPDVPRAQRVSEPRPGCFQLPTEPRAAA